MNKILLIAFGLIYGCYGFAGEMTSLFLPNEDTGSVVESPALSKGLNKPKIIPGYMPVQLNQAIFDLKSGDKLKFTTPSGDIHEVTFDRLAKSGKSRTWIGYTDGKKYLRVIITQRGTAVVGRMLTPEGAFVLKLHDGKLFVVDREQAGMKQEMPSKDDALVHPDTKTNKEMAPAESEAIMEKSSSTAKTMVDLLVLYNSDFADAYPGDSLQARIDYLIEISNQAYTDSNVNMALRVVHTQQINYSNTLSNNAALNAISGNTIPGVDIVALREAKRADLVTLMRPYAKPDHGSCGLAYLRTNLYSTTSVYSAVSDGDDVNGSLYYCLDYTMVHELGHNMGSTHDRANASNTPLYAYSYGYGIDGTFGTIMSYLRPVVGYFSNPDIQCAGYTCGVAAGEVDAANNALSLNNARTAISQLMTAIVADDLGGDGKADILLRNTSSGQLYLYEMDSNIRTSSNIGALNTVWTVQDIGDFGGDGKADILLRNSSSGQLYLYEMDGNSVTPSNIGALNPVWAVQGIGDFGGDGKADILLRNSSTGQLYLYEMDGNSVTPSNIGALNPVWTVQGIGDFGGDGKADILLRNSSTGQLFLYEMNGNSVTPSNIGALNPVWAVERVADYGGDGYADILLRNSSTGQLFLYEMDGNSVTPSNIGALSTSWAVEVQ